MEQHKLDEFIQQTCVRVYRNGRTRFNAPQDDGDEPRWRPRNRRTQNLMVQSGRIIEVGAFGQPKRVGRPAGSATKKTAWKLPEDCESD